jgi:pullulanase/glycogen debranching enzyme
VNYAASHDGFTLADTVAYAERHNEANGEDNRDGQGENFSANWGAEGQTAAPAILDIRAHLVRAILAAVFFAQGTPMLLAGDEFGRTQRGNNNAYCQDNELSWLEWKRSGSPEGEGLTKFVARLLALRRAHPVLRCRHFMHGKEELAPGLADMSWFDQDGQPISEEDWNNPEERIIVLRRAERNDDGAISAVTLLLNPTIESRTFKLPAPHVSTRMLIDTDKRDVAEHDLKGPEIEVADGRRAGQRNSSGCRLTRQFLTLPFGATLINRNRHRFGYSPRRNLPFLSKSMAPSRLRCSEAPTDGSRRRRPAVRARAIAIGSEAGKRFQILRREPKPATSMIEA